MNPKKKFPHFLSVILLTAFPLNGEAQNRDGTFDLRGLDVRIAGGMESDFHPLNWESVTGGALVLKVSEITDVRYGTRTSTAVYVEELTLRRRLRRGGTDLVDWLREVLVGSDPPKRTISAAEVLLDDSWLSTTTYVDALPVRYVFPVLTADGEPYFESLTVRPSRVETGNPQSVGARDQGRIFSDVPRFSVDGVDGVEPFSFSSVSIGDLVFGLIEYSPVEYSGVIYQAWGLGQPEYGQMTLGIQRGFGGSGLFDWWMQATRGRVAGRNLTVSIVDQNSGAVIRSYTFFDCVPVRYHAGDINRVSQVEEETITLSVGRVEFN